MSREAKTEMNKGSNIDADVILNAIKFLLNSKKNLNGLFINRELLKHNLFKFKIN